MKNIEVKNTNEEYLMDYIKGVYLEDPDSFLLIEIGANDGYCCDRMFPFVKEYDPNALMVEPLPDYFEQLQKNYSHLRNIKYENCAISNKECKKTMTYIPREAIINEKVRWRLEHSPHLWKAHWAQGLGSFYKDKNNLGCPELKEFQEEIVVSVKTFDYLFEKYDIEKYKNVIVQTDCEGHDLCVLKSFDFNRIKPRAYITEIYAYTKYPVSHPKYGKEVGMYSLDDEILAKKIFSQNGYTLYRNNDLIAVLGGE